MNIYTEWSMKTVNPLFSPPPPPGGLMYFKHFWGEVAYSVQRRWWYHFSMKNYNVLKYKKLEVFQ